MGSAWQGVLPKEPALEECPLNFRCAETGHPPLRLHPFQDEAEADLAGPFVHLGINPCYDGNRVRSPHPTGGSHGNRPPAGRQCNLILRVAKV
jgi:hypothetical protein